MGVVKRISSLRRKGCRAAVQLPVRAADYLRDFVLLCPAGGDVFRAFGCATVCEGHVGVFLLGLVERVEDTGGVGDVLRASKGDKGAGGVVGLGLRGGAGAGVVAGVDGGGGEFAREAGV